MDSQFQPGEDISRKGAKAQRKNGVARVTYEKGMVNFLKQFMQKSYNHYL
jgi:hypothetical protein